MKKVIVKLSALIMILTVTVVPLGVGCLGFGGAWNFAGIGAGYSGLDPWGFSSGYPSIPTDSEENGGGGGE